jgi:isoleucyl-tRNA synthetase
LIVSDEGTFGKLRHQLYPNQSTSPTSHQNEDKPPYKGGQREVIELPIYVLSNDLDKWILAELNKTLIEVDGHLQNYLLDEATKSAMDFMDKLTNRRLRRSRRRFRANGMNEDKSAAYATLYHVLKRYLQILAPFTPFITEYLWLQLADFTETSTERDLTAKTPSSIHLTSRPIANEHYLNETLIEETETVRKIIKLALFIRAKNKIAVKQPLQKLKIKID